MRIRLIKWWICLPFLALGFHWAIGSDMIARDAASSCLSRGHQLEARGDWAAATKEYERGIQKLPSDSEADRLCLQLAMQRARARNGQIVDALQQLKALQEVATTTGDPALLSDVRRELAVTSYYLGWLLRREGASRDKWERFAEAARQDFRYLAEQSGAASDQKNLEQVLHFVQCSDAEFRTKGLPEASLASNQGVGEAVEEEEARSTQSGAGKGGAQMKRQEEPSRSGGAGRGVQRGS